MLDLSMKYVVLVSSQVHLGSFKYVFSFPQEYALLSVPLRYGSDPKDHDDQLPGGPLGSLFSDTLIDHHIYIIIYMCVYVCMWCVCVCVCLARVGHVM